MKRVITIIKNIIDIIRGGSQIQIGSYAAELSFYTVFALVPLLLTIANIIVVFPLSHDLMMKTIRTSVPEQIQSLVVPVIEGYIGSIDTSSIVIGLLLTLWPISNIFNALKRNIASIYHSQKPQSFIISRAIAYIFTFGIVLLLVVTAAVSLWGREVVNVLETTFNLDLSFIKSFVNQSGIIGIVTLVLLMFVIYYYMPNCEWPIVFVIPGMVISIVGFHIISLGYGQILPFFSRTIGTNQIIALFMILLLWLYLNYQVIFIGAYSNVVIYEYMEKYKS